MRDNCHTLLVKYETCPIPDGENLRKFIAERLASDRTEIDYFGCEMDSGWDYVDQTLKTHLFKSCFITFQFEDQNAPAYGTSREEILRYMSVHFEDNQSRIIVDERRKDIDVYFD